jgi:hypothetical protein
MKKFFEALLSIIKNIALVILNITAAISTLIADCSNNLYKALK